MSRFKFSARQRKEFIADYYRHGIEKLSYERLSNLKCKEMKKIFSRAEIHGFLVRTYYFCKLQFGDYLGVIYNSDYLLIADFILSLILYIHDLLQKEHDKDFSNHIKIVQEKFEDHIFNYISSKFPSEILSYKLIKRTILLPKCKKCEDKKAMDFLSSLSLI